MARRAPTFSGLGRERSVTAMLFTLFAICMGVGFGLCGVGLLKGGNGWGLTMASVGYFLSFASLAGLIVTALIWLVNVIVELSRK